jgi:hypothetical protein
MKTLMRTLVLLCVLAHGAVIFAQVNPPKPTTAQSIGKQAFEKLRALAGSWQGEIMRIPISFTIRATSSGTTILHEAHTEGGNPPNHEITVLYMEGERLLATHYCDAGNQSHLEGKISPDGKTIKFSFLDVVGSKQGGYLKDMALTTVDADHHVCEITFIMPNGKAIPLRGEFTRTK